jgi:hypothetical protein
VDGSSSNNLLDMLQPVERCEITDLRRKMSIFKFKLQVYLLVTELGVEVQVMTLVGVAL